MNDKAKQALADYRAKVASGEIVPEKRILLNPQEKFDNKPTMKNAIAAKCWDCCNGQRSEIAQCSITDCSLYLYRPYKTKTGENDE